MNRFLLGYIAAFIIMGGFWFHSDLVMCSEAHTRGYYTAHCEWYETSHSKDETP